MLILRQGCSAASPLLCTSSHRSRSNTSPLATQDLCACQDLYTKTAWGPSPSPPRPPSGPHPQRNVFLTRLRNSHITLLYVTYRPSYIAISSARSNVCIPCRCDYCTVLSRSSSRPNLNTPKDQQGIAKFPSSREVYIHSIVAHNQRLDFHSALLYPTMKTHPVSSINGLILNRAFCTRATYPWDYSPSFDLPSARSGHRSIYVRRLWADYGDADDPRIVL